MFVYGCVYTAIYTIYRAVGPALGVCICHIQHIQPYAGQWGQLRVSVYAIIWLIILCEMK